MKNTKKFYTLFLASIIAFSTGACSQAGKILDSADVIPPRSEQETEGLKETEILEETDVDSILKTAAKKESSEAETSANTEPPQTTAEAPFDSGLSDSETSPAADSEGIRPEFQEAMDTYEAFYDEYCSFMKQYKENPSDLQLLAEYSDILSRAADMNAAFEAWEENELNNEELKYYLEVNNRVMQKLVDVAS